MGRMLIGAMAMAVSALAQAEEPFYMIRLRAPETDDAVVWQETFAALTNNAGCCDEVWFSTGVGYLPLEGHRVRAAKQAKAAAECRAVGILPGLQIQSTIGHQDFPPNVQGLDSCEAKTWQGWTGSQGAVSRDCSCPRHPDFIAYFEEVGRIYAAYRPSSVWIDDDLRASGHSPVTRGSWLGCWCARCVGDFAAGEGRTWTRESLLAAVKADEALAERWEDFQYGSLTNFAAHVARAIHAVSPTTMMSLQRGYRPHVRQAWILKAMADATGNKVGNRLGGGSWLDSDHYDMIFNGWLYARERETDAAIEPLVARWCPEIESCPRTFACRTPRGALVQAIIALGMGMDSISCLIMNSQLEPMSWYGRRFFSRLAANRACLMAYRDRNRGALPAGLAYRGESSPEDHAGMPTRWCSTAGVPLVMGRAQATGTYADFLKANGGKPIDSRQASSKDLLRWSALADEVSGGTLPVVLSDPVVGYLLPNVDPATRALRSVLFVNTTMDANEPFTVRLRGVCKSVRQMTWWALDERPVAVDVTWQGNDAVVRLPSLPAWSAGWLDAAGALGLSAHGSEALDLSPEKPYDFRRRLDVVHEPGLRDVLLKPAADEFALAEGAVIVVDTKAPALVVRAAEDFVDFLKVSMSVDARVVFTPTTRISQVSTAIEVKVDPTVKEGYTVSVDAKGVVLAAANDRQAAQALYHLEDLMSLRRAPFLSLGKDRRVPRFSPRMAHSGWECDVYPEAHLRRLAHAGIDAILIFLYDVDVGKLGPVPNVRDTMKRAAAWGIDTYIYSQVRGWKHPDDADAEQFFDHGYGRLVAAYPEAKGFIVVDENCRFPTKDPRVAPWDNVRHCKVDPNDPRPVPGYFPSYDYPAWFGRIQTALKKVNPKLELVFWAYAFVWQPIENATAFVDILPKDVSLIVTFEMGGAHEKRNGMKNIVEDYSLSFAGPGKYFEEMAGAAKRNGLKLYTMANSAGLEWDWGTIPYEPCPYQWKRRWDGVCAARGDYGVSGVMDSHHYGVWPSFITELEKEAYTVGGMPFDEHIRRIAARDFGVANVEKALEAWRGFSDAVRDMPPTYENQYGPFRIGPAFPFNAFGPELKAKDMPFEPMYLGRYWNELRSRLYDKNDLQGATHDTDAYLDRELDLFGNIRDKFFAGAKAFREIAATLEPRRAEKAWRMADLAEYMARGTVTAIHTRQAVRLEHQVKFLGLRGEGETKARARVKEIARAEYDNTRAALELMRRDSRLGWEPTMEYRGGTETVEWKLRRMEEVYGIGSCRQ